MKLYAKMIRKCNKDDWEIIQIKRESSDGVYGLVIHASMDSPDYIGWEMFYLNATWIRKPIKKIDIFKEKL